MRLEIDPRCLLFGVPHLRWILIFRVNFLKKHPHAPGRWHGPISLQSAVYEAYRMSLGVWTASLMISIASNAQWRRSCLYWATHFLALSKLLLVLSFLLGFVVSLLLVEPCGPSSDRRWNYEKPQPVPERLIREASPLPPEAIAADHDDQERQGCDDASPRGPLPPPRLLLIHRALPIPHVLAAIIPDQRNQR
jgi:hypothetical protein